MILMRTIASPSINGPVDDGGLRILLTLDADNDAEIKDNKDANDDNPHILNKKKSACLK